MDNEQETKKMKVTSIRMTEELCSQIDELAQKNQRTRNEQLNYMLKSWIEIKNFN